MNSLGLINDASTLLLDHLSLSTFALTALRISRLNFFQPK